MHNVRAAYYSKLLTENGMLDLLKTDPVFQLEDNESYMSSDWVIHLEKTFPIFLEYMMLSDKDIERFVDDLEGIIFCIKEYGEQNNDNIKTIKFYNFGGLLSLLLILKIKNPDMYADFIDDKIEIDQVVEYFFDFLPWGSADKSIELRRAALFILLLMRVFQTPGRRSDLFDEFNMILTDFHDENKIKIVPKKLMEMNSYHIDLIKYLKDTLEHINKHCYNSGQYVPFGEPYVPFNVKDVDDFLNGKIE